MSFAHLSPIFFKTHPLEREFFQRFDGHYPWNEQVLPVYAWDDLVYIAAVDPEGVRNANRAWPSHWVLLQCDAETLAQAWMEMREDATQPRIEDPEMHEVTSPPVAIPTPAMEPLSLNEQMEPPPKKAVETAKPAVAKTAVAEAPKVEVSKAATKSSDSEFDPEQLFASTNKKSVTVATSKPADEDDPFAAFGESASEDSTGSSEESDSSSAEEKEDVDGMPEGLEIPEGMKFSDGAPQGLGDSASAPEDLFASMEASLTKPESSAAAQDSETAEEQAPEVALELDEASPPEAAPVAAPVTPSMPASTPAAKAKPVAVATAEKPAKAAAPAPKTEGTEEFDENSLRLFPKEMVISLLKQVPDDFTHLFFALKAGNSLRMTAWTEDFTPAVGAEMDFSLSTPSPFRIALRTEKSYHGYLIESPYLDGFFKSWSQGIYPANLTVVPVMVADQIYGFMIAFGNANSSDRKHLTALERKAIEAAKFITEAAKTAQAS